jgi:hypothetical protein
MADIEGETGGGVNGDLSAVKLRFNGGNGCGLMVEGGGSCTGGGGAWRLWCSGGASREAEGLCLAARPEEDEGGWGSMVRERRGGGRWAGGSGSGEVGSVAWVGRLAKAEGVGGPAGLENKRKRKSIQN